jgi:hypothetical protein
MRNTSALEKLRGDLAEYRVLDLVRSLTSLPIGWARPAGSSLDKLGIDLLVFLDLFGNGTYVKVPVQVKSSAHRLQKWRTLHPECAHAGVIEIAAPWWRTDEDISVELEFKLWAVLVTKKRFDELFETLRMKVEVPSRHLTNRIYRRHLKHEIEEQFAYMEIKP